VAEGSLRLDEALAAVDAWPAPTVAAGAVVGGVITSTRGPLGRVFRWASVTKLLTAYAILVAAEEGVLDLDEPAGPRESTVRHLLAHASGLAFEGREPVSRPGRRRVYSNSGYVLLGELLERRSEMSFADYLGAAVLAPLGMHSCFLEANERRGAAAAGVHGPLVDLLRFTRELCAPRIVAPETLQEATSVQFPELVGILPTFGRQEPCDWGLGFEVRGTKTPHWTGARNSPRTFGHFGGSGTFVWVDPEADLALACLTDLEVGSWAHAAWPALSDAVLSAATSS
jgi:CubicO group peptidase (beta-lactamase class C family)